VPKFSPDKLRKAGYELFGAAGCRKEDAKSVVDHLVESNLFGHDSHGAIRFYEYSRAVLDGRFRPDASPKIVQDRACTAVVDGGGAMGQVGAEFATRLAMDKAKEFGIGTVSLRNTSHIGRAGAYPLMVAREAMIGQIFVNAGRLGYQIAPFGGIDGKLSTNPLAFAAPRRNNDPIMVDMTTSMVAEGKVRLALNQGKQVPPGWIIDSEGNSTTRPEDFKGDPPGAILPLGGAVGHKGYGMSIMVELLGGALSGQGCAAGEKAMISNGVLINVYHIDHFVDMEYFLDEVEDLITHVKSSRLAEGFDEILVPGEPEYRTAERRKSEGIEVDETTWKSVCEIGREVGVDLTKWTDN
jgi:uncharacterized oxidoreductase